MIVNVPLLLPELVFRASVPVGIDPPILISAQSLRMVLPLKPGAR
jgi:hypothetical protein